MSVLYGIFVTVKRSFTSFSTGFPDKALSDIIPLGLTVEKIGLVKMTCGSVISGYAVLCLNICKCE